MSEEDRLVEAGFEELSLGMSNYNHTIDAGLKEALIDKQAYARHAAWHFNAVVWHESGRFRAEIWRYGVPVALHEAESLEDLMHLNNEAFGYD